MAQDKSAEIIKFSGAAEPPQEPAPAPESFNADEAPAPEQPDLHKPGLEDLGAGAFLRAAREAANLSVEAVSAATKVKAEHVEAIEWMRLDRLPALAYITGFVKAYARYLGLDADQVAAAFKAEAIAATPAPVTAPAAEGVMPQGDGARLGSVFAMLAVILFALWIGYQVLGGGGHQEQPTATRLEARPAPASQAPQNAPAPVVPETSQIVETENAPVADETPAPDAAATKNLSPPETSAEEAAGAIPAAASDAQTVPSAEETTPAPEVTEEPVQAETPAPAVEEPRERALPRRARPAPPPRQPVIVKAELSRSIAPDYPNRCTRGANDMESVTLRFDVSAEGRAVNMRVASSTNNCFETEALNTVGRWRFSPRTVDGASAVETGKTATLNFRK
ncbi:TonB family protein [Marinicaulis aureus]|uniref:TonB family protein n=1 Tax=Hyphococcus aureus TaxID=2666033 RepID=A0ABW1KXB4_9PROT